MGIGQSLIGQGLRHIRFLHKQKNALKRERRKGKKNGGPVADIDRKQAPGGGGEIRTHVPVRTT